MRRILVLVLAVLLIASMAVSVSAETGATQATYQVTVSTDESCSVTVAVSLHLDEAVDDLSFPVPLEASNITLNGTRVGATIANGARNVDLSGIVNNMAGDFTFTISYYLKDVIGPNEDGILELTLPLLTGFAYPVEKVGFTVTMPGVLAYKPAFSSGYHRENIEQQLIFSSSGNTVTGTSSQTMKDRETLTMTLQVTEEMFPQSGIRLQNLEPYYLIMAICGVLALLYWIFFLRNLPPRVNPVAAPPQGYSAGELSAIISLQGINLTAMIFSWAQLGYLTIQAGRTDRVLLHKQMEMGNERSPFEQKCFRNLFGNRNVVDASGARFSSLYQKLSVQRPSLYGLVYPFSGGKVPFRFLMALVGAFCGVCLGLVLSAEAAIQWIPALLLAAACGAASWLIQEWANCLYAQYKGKLVLSLLLCAGWIALSIHAGTAKLDVWIVLLQLLAGLMTTFGGRRTEAGRQLMAEVMGFRLFLQSISRAQLSYIRRQNPEYYHDLAPYALALGADQAFASRFGRDKQPPCPYITGVPQKPMTASEWCSIYRRIARSIEARTRQLPLEKLTGFFRSFTR